MTRRRYRWRGPQPACAEEQIANAPDDFAALTPVSDTRAVQTAANWAALLPSSVPFAGERRTADPAELLDDFPPVNQEA